MRKRQIESEGGEKGRRRNKVRRALWCYFCYEWSC